MLKGLQSQLHYQPKLILCDLDGTLVDSAADIAIALNRALDDLGLAPVTDTQVRRWVGQGAMRLIHCVIDHGRLDPALHPVLLNQFMNRYMAAVCEVSEVYPGVREFLAACHADGITLACVTNKPYQAARDLLAALDLLDDFQLLIGGDTLPHRKPHPEPLLHCLRHFEMSVEEALMVGDSRNDVDAAKAAQMKVVAVSYGYNHGEPVADTQPDWLVDSLASLI
jgi:phosphoglycolate phosphatase